MSVLEEILLPDIGDFKNVPIIELFVKPGDSIAAEQALMTLESDKATMDVPSPKGGIVREVLVAVGDSVSRGSPVLRIEAAGEQPANVPTAPVATGSPAPAVATLLAAAPPAVAAIPASTGAPTTPPDTATRSAHASPSVRRFARELGVDIGQVAGTGTARRITKEDVQSYVKRSLAQPAATAAARPGGGLDLLPWPQVDFTRFGPVERQPLSRIKKISGANLARNWVMVPHVTNFDEADITDLEDFRLALNKEGAKGGPKVTMTAFLIKALADAIGRFPEFGASLDGDELVLKQYRHVGFAADTPNGLVVPVVRDANMKGILQIAAETAELAGLARDGKLKPADMQGGCISVSSLGGIGGTGFTPIINAPEVSILGVTKAQWKPVWDGGQFVPRLTLPLCLSWDHRVIDGAAAARFLVHLKSTLADFRRVLL